MTKSEHEETQPKEIWIVSLVAKILSNRCSIAFDGSECLQGHLCVPAHTIQEAITAAELDCKRDFLKVIQINKCIKYDKSEWLDSSTEDTKSLIHSIELAQTKQCIHGVFYGEDFRATWSHSVFSIEIE